VTLGWTVDRHSWIDDPAFRGRTVLAGYALAAAVNEGRVAALPVRLGSVPRMIEEHPPDLAVVAGVRRGTDLVFGASVGWADVLARNARSVVVELDHDGIDLGAPCIDGNIVATLDRATSTTTAVATSRPADDLDLQIGALVASMIPDDATLQFGPGGIGEGIARSLDRPVRIRSGLVTDAMARLHRRGLLLEPAIAAYAWGGPPIVELAHAGMLRLASCTETHDISRLASVPRMIGCNTALQVGLDGAVNVESVDGRIIAAVGGHSDFCAGASQSVGGLSIIAVRSTTSKGSSTIVPTVDRVSTQRSDIDVVVTEHGIADLRGVDDHTRSARLIAIAAPEHRRWLEMAPTAGPTAARP
jgi:acyl-CoA hydrolase